MDRSKLIKFLNLSTSKNDSESLSSIKKANEYILENNLTWEELFEETHLQVLHKRLYTENKRLHDDINVCSTTLRKERIVSEELENGKNILKYGIKLLFTTIVVLIVAYILK